MGNEPFAVRRQSPKAAKQTEIFSYMGSNLNRGFAQIIYENQRPKDIIYLYLLDADETRNPHSSI